MTFFGIELKRPGFWPLTQSVVIAVILWSILTLSPLGAESAVGAGANLVAIGFGCVSNVIGIEVKRGGRHLFANVFGCVLVLLVYGAVASLL